ncbi:MAG TPA: metalloprotease family protein [Ktedonobacterales bacterium]|nr:metalloprotease family protein [Ktedonobacterales bacterium]
MPIDALREVHRVTLLSSERLPDLARKSFWLFAGSGIAFAVFDMAARLARPVPALFGDDSAVPVLIMLVLANTAAYVAVLGVHEALHAATILALSGHPRFGLKLPFALYCTAPNQLFTRGGYMAVALAPFVLLTVLGVVVTWLAPNLGAYLWLAWVGNVSGAVGDLVTASELRRVPANVLIADTQDGFIAYSRVS